MRAIISCVSGCGRATIGMSPSGKAPDFDSGIRRFESYHPSQKLWGQGLTASRSASSVGRAIAF